MYGIRQGSEGKSHSNYFNGKSQKDLAVEIGMTQQQLSNFKRLHKLIPELQEMVEEGELKSTTAQLVWSKLNKDEQEKFFNEIGKEQIANMTQKQTQEIVLKNINNSP